MPTWSKEDRISYDKSEVFQELEKLTIANIHRLDILRKKANTAKTLNETAAAAKAAASAMRELGEAKRQLGANMAEDQLSEMNAEDVSMLSGVSKEMVDKMMNEAMDAKVSETIVDELMEMKEAAIKEGNTKLAYKIERTLDEILSVETL
jgi:hypothetical protein